MRLSLVLPLVLAGCGAAVSQAPSGPPVPPPGQDSCQATPFAGLVGQADTALERVLIMRQVRVIRPGQPVTRDLRPARINFEIDRSARIARIFCG